MAEPIITVEVVYAGSDRLLRQIVRLAVGSTAEQAIAMSGIPEKLAAGAVDLQRLGIHGRKIAPNHCLADGDRVEICRGLMLDPMEARRRRARG